MVSCYLATSTPHSLCTFRGDTFIRRFSATLAANGRRRQRKCSIPVIPSTISVTFIYEENNSTTNDVIDALHSLVASSLHLWRRRRRLSPESSAGNLKDLYKFDLRLTVTGEILKLDNFLVLVQQIHIPTTTKQKEILDRRILSVPED